MAALPCGGYGRGRIGDQPPPRAHPSDRGRVAPSPQAKSATPQPGELQPCIHPLPVRPQADPGRADWRMRPARRPLRPHPGAVTPPRDDQARIPTTWAKGPACWPPVAVPPWLTGGQVAQPWPTTLPPPANYRRRRWQAAYRPWTAASSVVVVASPCLAAPVGPDRSVTRGVHPKVVSSAELPGRLPVPGSGQDPQTRPFRGEGARVEDDGPAGNRPQSDAAPRGPG
jgi:hypothetical protein